METTRQHHDTCKLPQWLSDIVFRNCHLPFKLSTIYIYVVLLVTSPAHTLHTGRPALTQIPGEFLVNSNFTTGGEDLVPPDGDISGVLTQISQQRVRESESQRVKASKHGVIALEYPELLLLGQSVEEPKSQNKIKVEASDVRRQASGVRHQASGARRQVSGLKRLKRLKRLKSQHHTPSVKLQCA